MPVSHKSNQIKKEGNAAEVDKEKGKDHPL